MAQTTAVLVLLALAPWSLLAAAWTGLTPCLGGLGLDVSLGLGVTLVLGLRATRIEHWIGGGIALTSLWSSWGPWDLASGWAWAAISSFLAGCWVLGTPRVARVGA